MICNDINLFASLGIWLGWFNAKKRNILSISRSESHLHKFYSLCGEIESFSGESCLLKLSYTAYHSLVQPSLEFSLYWRCYRVWRGILWRYPFLLIRIWTHFMAFPRPRSRRCNVNIVIKHNVNLLAYLLN